MLPTYSSEVKLRPTVQVDKLRQTGAQCHKVKRYSSYYFKNYQAYLLILNGFIELVNCMY